MDLLSLWNSDNNFLLFGFPYQNIEWILRKPLLLVLDLLDSQIIGVDILSQALYRLVVGIVRMFKALPISAFVTMGSMHVFV